VGNESEVGADGNEAMMRDLAHAAPTGCGGRVVLKAASMALSIRRCRLLAATRRAIVVPRRMAIVSPASTRLTRSLRRGTVLA
jgi:hypothetical protein